MRAHISSDSSPIGSMSQHRRHQLKQRPCSLAIYQILHLSKDVVVCVTLINIANK